MFLYDYNYGLNVKMNESVYLLSYLFILSLSVVNPPKIFYVYVLIIKSKFGILSMY